MTDDNKLCPICEEGYLTLKSYAHVMRKGSYTANVYLNYAECSSCGCETLYKGQDIENIFNVQQFYYDAENFKRRNNDQNICSD